MMLSKLAVRRVTKLCEFMEALPATARKHFSMAVVLRHFGDHVHPPIKEGRVRLRDIHTCGTTACALGYAASMPYFKRNGLRVVCGGLAVDGQLGSLGFDGTTDPEAWRILFGCHNRDRTPKQWAKRARRYLAAQGEKS